MATQFNVLLNRDDATIADSVVTDSVLLTEQRRCHSVSAFASLPQSPDSSMWSSMHMVYNREKRTRPSYRKGNHAIDTNTILRGGSPRARLSSCM
eukprot:826770-Pelagomonas_calceolata.AAC.14